MTDAEYVDFRRVHDHGYADMHVQAGNWTPDEALAKAAAEMSQLLGEGVNQPDTLLLTAVAEDNSAIGRMWLSLKHPRGFPKTAYLYYIEVLPAHRGQGLGRPLLEAVEQEAARHGIERSASTCSVPTMRLANSTHRLDRRRDPADSARV